ncbi:MMPL family transporter, partial [bacterium]|nr:MMPL family transporter [bacterium]
MRSALSPANLARSCARHPWLTLGVWLLVVIGAVVSVPRLNLDNQQTIYGVDAQKAQDLLKAHMNAANAPGESVVFDNAAITVDDPAYKAFVEQFEAKARNLQGVLNVSSYYDSGAASLVNKDRHMTLVSVDLTGDAAKADKTVEPLLGLIKDSQTQGFTVITAGDGSINRDLNKAFNHDLELAEVIGMPASIVVLVIVFGAAVAAGVPIILALLAILVAMGATALLSQVFTIGSLTMNMITMIGLAVGIDYTLFIVERFREERRRGVDKVAAIATAGNTASRAVLFSGMTVVIALAGLLIVPSSDFRGMAIGAIAVVVAAVALALTVLPAGLSLLDRKLNWLSLPGRKQKPITGEEDPHHGFFGKTTDLVMKHPVVSVVTAGGLLIAAAVPVFKLQMGNPGLSEFPEHLASVHAFNVINTEFSAGRLTPTNIVIDGNINNPQVVSAIDKLTREIQGDSRFATVEQLHTDDARDLGLLTTIINGDGTGAEAKDAVRDLRSTYVPNAFKGVDANVYVGGQTAGTVDYIDTMSGYLPILMAFVLGLSFLLLTMVFRSIVIPLQAILLNLLSVGAAYGLLVLVFQEWLGSDLFGFRQSDELAAYLLVFLFAILFGLSMDYHVFLLSRIQEGFAKTGNTRLGVATGLRSTAHIITGAAAIMMVVFGGFAAGDMVPLQQTGFGLAAAVFIDATLVRSVLVPAGMVLLGKWNWYLPS